MVSLALFDFDGTMIRGDSIVPFVRFALKRGDMKKREFLSACFQGIQFRMHLKTGGEMKKKALSFYARLAPEEKKALDTAFARDYLLPRVYDAARKALERHKQEGRITVLVSASTENYMQYIAPALGFDHLLCTPMDQEGRVLDNCHGEEKARRIRAFLEKEGLEADWEHSFAYGDSRGDLPMLSLCGHPVPVNAKTALKKAAPDMARKTWR